MTSEEFFKEFSRLAEELMLATHAREADDLSMACAHLTVAAEIFKTVVDIPPSVSADKIAVVERSMRNLRTVAALLWANIYAETRSLRQNRKAYRRVIKLASACDNDFQARARADFGMVLLHFEAHKEAIHEFRMVHRLLENHPEHIVVVVRAGIGLAHALNANCNTIGALDVLVALMPYTPQIVEGHIDVAIMLARLLYLAGYEADANEALVRAKDLIAKRPSLQSTPAHHRLILLERRGFSLDQLHPESRQLRI